MVFSFNIPNWLLMVTNDPLYVTIWSAFGVPLVIFIVSTCVFFLGKLKLSGRLNILLFAFFEALVMALVMAWLIGFIVSMLLLFSDIEAIKMILIWLSIFVSSFIFCIVNRKALNIFTSEISASEKAYRSKKPI